MSRKMKESGIDWIGSIPMPWNTIKFKYLHGGLMNQLTDYSIPLE